MMLLQNKYLAIRDELLREIKSGVYDKTGALPGEKELVARFKSARETVRRAISELEALNLVRRKKGAGTFIQCQKRSRSGLLALLIPNVTSAKIFKEFADEIGRLARRNGYRIIVQEVEVGAVPDARLRVRRIARELAVKRVDGVIFRPLVDERMGDSNREIVRIFKNAETPVVLIDADVEEPPNRSSCDLVTVDNVSAGRRVAVHLLQQGKRRIAFMTNGRLLSNNVNWRNRLFGVAGELALRKVRTAVCPLDFKPTDRKSLRALWSGRKGPDAIVCGNDETAATLEDSLLAIGKHIPQDVAVVGFDDADIATSCAVPLTTVRQPARLIARTVLRTLLARIAHPRDDSREIHLETSLVVRDSTKGHV